MLLGMTLCLTLRLVFVRNPSCSIKSFYLCCDVFIYLLWHIYYDDIIDVIDQTDLWNWKRKPSSRSGASLWQKQANEPSNASPTPSLFSLEKYSVIESIHLTLSQPSVNSFIPTEKVVCLVFFPFCLRIHLYVFFPLLPLFFGREACGLLVPDQGL